jgi:hypothetical protein
MVEVAGGIRHQIGIHGFRLHQPCQLCQPTGAGSALPAASPHTGILNCDENVHCTWLIGDVFWPPQDNSSTVASGRVILVDIFKARRWPRTGRPAGSHGALRMEKALSARLTGRRPGRAKSVRVARQLVWVEDRVTSGRGHLQQLATRCRSYGFPDLPAAEDLTRKGGKAHLLASTRPDTQGVPAYRLRRSSEDVPV